MAFQKLYEVAVVSSWFPVHIAVSVVFILEPSHGSNNFTLHRLRFACGGELKPSTDARIAHQSLVRRSMIFPIRALSQLSTAGVTPLHPSCLASALSGLLPSATRPQTGRDRRP